MLGSFFFDPLDTADYVSIVTADAEALGLDRHLAAAEAVVYERRFPLMVNYDTFTVQEPPALDWIEPAGTDHPEYVHTLNRHSFWYSMALASLSTDDVAYVEDLRYQLASWSMQYQSVEELTDGSPLNILDAGTRTHNWVWTWFSLLGEPAWTPADNTLMLSRLIQHGDLLHEQVAGFDERYLASNRGAVVSAALLSLGQVLQGVDSAGDWRDIGRHGLFEAMDLQFRDDGSHIEQAPNYAFLTLEYLMTSLRLEGLNGSSHEWTAQRVDELRRAMDAAEIFIQPDGNMAAIGNTFRSPVRLGLQKRLVLDDAAAPAAGRLGRVWADSEGFNFAYDGSIHIGDMLLMEGRVARISYSVCDVLTGVWASSDPDDPMPEAGAPFTNLGQGMVHAPTLRDLWMFGPEAVEPYRGLPEGVFARRPSVEILPDGGTVRLRDPGGRAQLLFNAGPSGSGHGHYDLLNIGLVGERPLLPDAGVYTYDGSEQQQFARSTPAHNTLIVDGKNHRQITDAAAADGQVRLSAPTPHEGGMLLHATHSGFNHLAGSPIVSRSLWFDGRSRAVLVDRFTAGSPHDYMIGLNLPNQVRQLLDGGVATAFDTDTNLRIRPLLLPGQVMSRTPNYVTHAATVDPRVPGWRLSVEAADAMSAVFVTVLDWGGPTSDGLSLLTQPLAADDDVLLRFDSDRGIHLLHLPAPPPHAA